MITFEDVKIITTKRELVEKIDEMVFFLGSDVTDNNAEIIAGFIDTLHILKGHINGEPACDNLVEDITEIAYFLGAEMDATNWPFVSQSILTLHEAKNFIKND